nr:MAG TPA: hypothetical protein [Caudoviricetes sp.]
MSRLHPSTSEAKHLFASTARVPSKSHYRRRPCESQQLSAGDFCAHFWKSTFGIPLTRRVVC